MSENGREWDLALTEGGNKTSPMLRVNLPSPISRSLMSAGYTRAKVTLTDEGILVRPYKGGSGFSRPREDVVLPESWST